MSDEHTKAYIKALLSEREGYERHGRTERVAEVDAELERVGHDPKPPAKRATKFQGQTAKQSSESD